MNRYRGYSIKIERTRTGYCASVVPKASYFSVLVAGDTRDKARRMAEQGIDMALDYDPRSDGTGKRKRGPTPSSGSHQNARVKAKRPGR